MTRKIPSTRDGSAFLSGILSELSPYFILPDMEKLDLILQEMLTARFGRTIGSQILDRCRESRDFAQHLDSYGTQRVGAPEQNATGTGRDLEFRSMSLLLASAAELLQTTVSSLLEELGGFAARNIPGFCSQHATPSSAAGFFEVLAFLHSSCAGVFELISTGSFKVETSLDGSLNIQCSLWEDDLWEFLEGFFSEIQRRFEGDSSMIHSRILSPQGQMLHSFTFRRFHEEPMERVQSLAEPRCSPTPVSSRHMELMSV